MRAWNENKITSGHGQCPPMSVQNGIVNFLIKKERSKIRLSCRWPTHPHQRSREPYIFYVWLEIIQFYCALHNNLPSPSSRELGILNALANTFKNNILTI